MLSTAFSLCYYSLSMLNLLHRMGQERPFSAADPALPKLELLAMKGAFELDVLRAAFKNEAVEDLQAWAKSVRR